MKDNLFDDLNRFQFQMRVELADLLFYWDQYTKDEEYGGFVGQIDGDNKVVPFAPKGSVLNCRILYTFSAAYIQTKNPTYLSLATRAFAYIKQFFINREYGGIYWTVDYSGKPLDTKNQVYALAFAIYGFTEYYKATENSEALALAQKLYQLIEWHSFDNEFGGYIEAFDGKWQTLTDVRLSNKDDNAQKTMNTHLHILEAYTNLYKVWPSAALKDKVLNLLHCFFAHIVHPAYHSLKLFFNMQWLPTQNIISYGHDIEAAWLLLEAAEAIEHKEAIEQCKRLAVNLADAVVRGLDIDGGLLYEYDLNQKHLVNEKHWWVQAEAMVGFFNAYELTAQESYLNYAINSWNYIKNNLKDTVNGEWFWGIDMDGKPMENQDKVGLWKCPYHNSRACLQIMERTSKVLQQNLV